LPHALKHYPDYADVHQENISALTGTPAENIVVANGSTEVITLLCRDVQGPLVTSVPTFGRWTDLPSEFQVPASYIHRLPQHNFELDPDEVLARVTSLR